MSKNLYNAIQLFLEATRPTKRGMSMIDNDAWDKAGYPQRPEAYARYHHMPASVDQIKRAAVDGYDTSSAEEYLKQAAINKSIRRHNDREDVARFKRGATPSREQFRQIRKGERDLRNNSTERADAEHAERLKWK